MQAGHLWRQRRAVGAFAGHPVIQRSLVSFPVCQSMSNRKASVPLQLRQDDQHLPVKRGDAVAGFEATSSGHDIEAVSAIALDVQKRLRMTIFYDHNKPGPSVR